MKFTLQNNLDVDEIYIFNACTLSHYGDNKNHVIIKAALASIDDEPNCIFITFITFLELFQVQPAGNESSTSTLAFKINSLTASLTTRCEVQAHKLTDFRKQI